MEFNSLVLQMKKWRFGGAKLLQYHTVVGGRVKIWVHLCCILKSGVFSTSGYIQNWKISISVQMHKTMAKWAGRAGWEEVQSSILWTASQLWPGPFVVPGTCGWRGDECGLSQPLSLFRPTECHWEDMHPSKGKGPLSSQYPAVVPQPENFQMWEIFLRRLQWQRQQLFQKRIVWESLQQHLTS